MIPNVHTARSSTKLTPIAVLAEGQGPHQHPRHAAVTQTSAHVSSKGPTVDPTRASRQCPLTQFMQKLIQTLQTSHPRLGQRRSLLSPTPLLLGRLAKSAKPHGSSAMGPLQLSSPWGRSPQAARTLEPQAMPSRCHHAQHAPSRAKPRTQWHGKSLLSTSFNRGGSSVTLRAVIAIRL